MQTAKMTASAFVHFAPIARAARRYRQNVPSTAVQDEGSALARLDVLELNDLKDLAVLLEGDAVAEFACRNHIKIPP